MYYTIGQRRGLNIGTTDKIFVVGKDMDKNILYIAYGENNPYLVTTSCVVDHINWIGVDKPEKCTAKFRYRQKDNDVSLEYRDDYIIVRYPQGVKAVTPGQACVFYNGEECLGGGIIKEVRRDEKKLWYL